MSVSYQFSPRSLTVLVSGRPPAIFDNQHSNYQAILDIVKANSDVSGKLSSKGEKLVEDLLFKQDDAVRSMKGFNVTDGVVFVDGVAVPQFFGDRIRALAQQGLNPQPSVNFWRRAKRNPSYQAVRELADCLERNHHPLLPDGRFIGWKGVRSDFYDKWSGKFDNSVGNVVRMERFEVDDDRNRQCSHGLHVGSYEYARDYAGSDGVLVEVAVCPSHAVSVPTDSNFQKMRVSEYQVLSVCKSNYKDVELVDDYVDYPQWAYDAGYQDGLDSDYESCFSDVQSEQDAYDDGYLDGEREASSIEDEWESDNVKGNSDFLSRKAKLQKRDSSGRFSK